MEEIKVYNFVPQETTIKVSKLTNIQRHYVEVIERFKAENKRIPTQREVQDILELNAHSTVHNVLYRLSLKGYDYKNTVWQENEFNSRFLG